MKLKFSFLSVFAMAAFYQGQNFVEQTTNFKDFYYSSSSVGDFNNDGFLDIAITGAIDSDEDGNVDTTVTYIYKNINGKLTEHQVLQAPVHLGDIKFIDIDNDGDLDIVSVGLSYQDIVNHKTYVYINNNGSFVLDKSDVGKIYSSIELADFNHDGKMDYFINGVEYQSGVGIVFEMDYYKNTGGKFQKNKNFLPGTQNGSFKIVDFNNDQHLDFLVSGLDKDYQP
ncbi:VCBS repeat-containing protein [Soonwooa sp.]|uniref:FG-GAP repeat domain-containing protein n=1 Tax=Soonwooa sp. TaxID=1938592 RepID=UPI002636184F|nr:VCBS repeat-containing protein [Soonwooa sp.]